jgi:ATP-dependent DNA helicase DinG
VTGDLRAIFAPDGLLSEAHPGYEHRPGQEEMARAVDDVLRDGGTIMVEAGTGTGKTLAYLVPAILSGRRVIVSTGTRNLQDQIFRKDLPFIAERLGIPVSAVLMKGRENYLCKRKFAEFETDALVEVRAEARWIPELSRWSRATRSGDRAEVADLPDDLRFWRDVNARADTCTGTKCPEYETCWLTLLKRAAQDAQIVVVNHHLFFADLAVRSAFGAVLPEYDSVVFDEAHLIEETATLFFGLQVSAAQIEDLARDAEKLAAARGGPAKGAGGAATLREAAELFFEPFRARLRGVQGRLTLAPPERGGLEVEPDLETLQLALKEAARLAAAEAEAGETGASVVSRAEELAASLREVLARSRTGFVYGMELRGRSNVVLSAAPIDVSAILADRLFSTLHACVLTSATLSVGGSFDFFKTRLGLAHAESRIVSSPFDHARQARLYLPKGMPEPRDARFLARALEEIRGLLEITRGRAFLLFTSYAVLQRVKDELEREGRWTLFAQGDGSKAALVERFRDSSRAVLLGTASFWHGVDVPGEALSLVVIDKLPFDVPSDPLVAARIAKIREDGGNPFGEYQLPLAVLELKQGLGRLLRTTSDRGILAVLDPRLTSKTYGKTFLKSLPPYPVLREMEACAAFFADAPTES